MTLTEFFEIHNKAAIAFSGGVDSAYLAYAAKKSGADICAYYVNSAFQPAFELKDAENFAEMFDIGFKILNIDILGCDKIISNSSDRCYYCKHLIFESIMAEARKDGYNILIDGTNASDVDSERPGMKAGKELGIISPLKECGLTKTDIRRLSSEAGLFTAVKPSYSCLATRIKTDELITAEKLKNIEKAENFLFRLGFSDFRVRFSDGTAKLQFAASEYEKALKDKENIIREMEIYFPTVLSEFEVRT